MKERKRMAGALREQEAEFRLFFESMSDKRPKGPGNRPGLSASTIQVARESPAVGGWTKTSGCGDELY